MPWEAELTRRITAEYPKAKFTMGSMENENTDRTYWFIRCGRDANEIDSVVRCNEIFDAVQTEYTTWYHPEVKPVNSG